MTEGTWGPVRRLATGLDRLMAGTRYVGCLENVIVPQRDYVTQALTTITRFGPHTRLGLTPSPTARLWDWEPQQVPTIRDLPADVADNGTAAVLEYIRRLPVPRSPVDVYLSDRHIAFDIDHGLSDARLYIDCITALFDIEHGTSSAWLRERDTQFPLGHALTHTFGGCPRRLRQAWHEVKQRPSATARPSSSMPAGTSNASCSVEVVHVDDAAEWEVERWRAAHAPDASRTVIWLSITRAALAHAGLPLSDTVRLVVDCRRFLRPGDRVNANFISGLNVLAPVERPANAIGAAVKADLEAALPLLALTATSARYLAFPARTSRDRIWQPDMPVQVVYSDVGRLTPFESLPWIPGQPRSINASLEPGAPWDISVFSGTIGHERSVTLSYHDTVHDRHILQEAAEAIRTDPIRLLR
ncbi:hypothetical protein [Mycolicibacterium sphagni]|uniref:hypothetical protein n=1 Tax=Mycolicibacterium sphagni TaxID=1786 RepID=UPI0021F35E5F|nr:hypothetical protein [Mycolicibacterium sphagni]MCV7178475.1 hypothetical protein [Mycolicibacterium sphagni]